MKAEPTLTLIVDAGRTSFEPGETVKGTVSWAAAEAPSSLEVRLFWFARSKASEHVGVADVMAVRSPQPIGGESFALKSADAPYSFVGELITLTWAVEAVFEPGRHAARIEIVVGPRGRVMEI